MWFETRVLCTMRFENNFEYMGLFLRPVVPVVLLLRDRANILKQTLIFFRLKTEYFVCRIVTIVSEFVAQRY